MRMRRATTNVGANAAMDEEERLFWDTLPPILILPLNICCCPSSWPRPSQRCTGCGRVLRDGPDDDDESAKGHTRSSSIVVIESLPGRDS